MDENSSKKAAEKSSSVSYSREKTWPSTVWNKISGIFSNRTIAVAGVLILVVGVGAGIIAVQRSTEYRQQAAAVPIELGTVSSPPVVSTPYNTPSIQMIWHHNINRSDPNGLLIVNLYMKRGPSGSGAMYSPGVLVNGNLPMTKLAEKGMVDIGGGSINAIHFIYYLKNPPAGNIEIKANVTSATDANYWLGSSVNYFGVDQAKPFDVVPPFMEGSGFSGSSKQLLHNISNSPMNSWTQKDGQIFLASLLVTSDPNTACNISVAPGMTMIKANANSNLVFGVATRPYVPNTSNDMNWKIQGCVGSGTGAQIYSNFITKLNPAQSSTGGITPTPTKKPNGSSCSSNSECISNVCSFSFCIAQVEQPSPPPKTTPTPTVKATATPSPTPPGTGGPTAPSAPTNLIATCNSTNTRATFTWNAVTGATGYNFFSNGPAGGQGWGLSTNTTSIGVTLGANYTWNVKACKDSACSAAVSGPTITCGTAVAKPAAPVLDDPVLQCIGTDSQAVLDWIPVSGATGYNIYKFDPSISSSTWTKIASSPSFSYTYSSLSHGTGYTLRVTATNTAGESDFSNYVGFTAKTCIVNTPIPATQTLTITKYGTGTGTVTSSPSGINCGSDCSQTYNTNTSVTLTAVPSAGSVFANWFGGGCTGTNPVCTIAMNVSREPKAQFSLSTILTPTPTPTTTVTYNSADIDRNGCINIIDFNLWRKAFIEDTYRTQYFTNAVPPKQYYPNVYTPTTEKVSILDFNKWRSEFIKAPVCS